MATENANAMRVANANHEIDAHMDRIGKVLGIAPPPRGRADTRDSRGAQDSERIAQFLSLVSDSVDPSNAGKRVATPQQLGGIGDGYNDSDEEQRKRAEAHRDRLLKGLGEPEETTTASAEEEEKFGRPGRPLSAFDAIPDDQLEQQDGVGEVTAKEIVKARHKRDRAAGK